MIEVLDFEKKVHKYNKYSKESFVNQIFPKEYTLLIWHVNSDCNFNCEFCNTKKTNDNQVYRTPPRI